jgi:hypothetical protein
VPAVAGAVTFTDCPVSAPALSVPPAFCVMSAGAESVPLPPQDVLWVYFVETTLEIVGPDVVKRMLPSVKLVVAVPEGPVAVT